MTAEQQPIAPKLTGMAYLPRWIAGVLCYITFGLGGFLSSISLLPLLLVLPGSKQQRISRVQKAVHYMFRGFVHMLTWAGIIKLNVQQQQRLLNARGVIVVVNHPTLIDVVVLISLMPNAGCIVKQALWRNPFLRGVVSCAGYIPNRGADLLLADCQKVLEDGTNLIIFPEGTRTQVGKTINPFARGAANIALRTQHDILPVVLKTNAIGLTKQQPWYDIPRQTIGMNVEVGRPLVHTQYQADTDTGAKLARKMTRDLEAYYIAHLSTRFHK